MGRGARNAVLVATATLCAAVPAHATPVSSEHSEAVVASGLGAPTAVAFLPDRRMLVTEKGGALKLVDDGAVSTLTTIPVCTASEMGLLGIAPDPSFDSNGFVYLYRTKPAASGCDSATGRFNQVVRVTMSGNTVVPGSLTELLTGIRTDNGNHDGGALRFGPDGKLWVAVGDTGLGDGGAPGESTNPYSQDLAALEGKILRLERSGAPAAGNPFIGQPPARPEVYAYGFRNPWRMGFDDQTGRLWVGDVGQGAREEIDVIQPAGNYAWPRCEGTLPAGCQEVGDVDPVFEYPHSGAGALGRTVIGGAFLGSFGFVGGRYVFADYIADKLYIAVPNLPRTDISAPTDLVIDAGGPVDIVVGPDDAVYWAALNSGEVRKLVPGYPRPRSAMTVKTPLVPAFQACTSPNRMHGPPLASGSCNPPVPQSTELTVGTPDSNGAPVNSSGSVRLHTLAGDPGTPVDDADVQLAVTVSDVRRVGNLADYTGELQARASLRITDRDNAAPAGSAAGTVQNLPYGWTVPCTATADTSIGSTCNVSTSADAVLPGLVKEGLRSVWELGKIVVFDGGPDGLAGTTPNTVFAAQGVFVP